MVIDEKARLNKIFSDDLFNKLLNNRESLRNYILDLRDFLNRFYRCFTSSEFIEVELNYPFCIRLVENSFSSNSVNLLSINNLLQIIDNQINNNLFQIVFKGNQIENAEKKYIEDIPNASLYSKNEDCILLFFNGKQVTFFVNGIPIEFIPNILTYKRTGVSNGKELPIAEYKILINRYSKNEIQKGRFDYWWLDKQNFLLIGSPEKDFRKQLAWFFRENTFDIVDEECFVEATANRTDIKVTTVLNEIYYFEIKWLGKNNGSNYEGMQAIKTVNGGFEQLNDYLKINKNALCGVLVIYDARKELKEIELLEQIKLNKKIDKEPVFIVLNPKSSSTKSKEIVNEIIKEKRKRN